MWKSGWRHLSHHECRYSNRRIDPCQSKSYNPGTILQRFMRPTPRARTGSSSTRARLIRTFQRRLLSWYRHHRRPLPWRDTKDPYKILVSEIMLQQTQVDRVIPKYHEFLHRYPTVRELAKARTSEVKRVWYPLGYNIRPVRLRNIAKTVVARYDGRIPSTYEGLLALDGIGRYTAGAVLSFAFNQDAPIVDTNVARLLSRYFGVAATRVNGKVASSRRLWALAQAVIPPGNAYDINQAMMDFGALICTAQRPRCATCTLRMTCRSFPYVGSSTSRDTGRHRRR